MERGFSQSGAGLKQMWLRSNESEHLIGRLKRGSNYTLCKVISHGCAV